MLFERLNATTSQDGTQPLNPELSQRRAGGLATYGHGRHQLGREIDPVQ